MVQLREESRRTLSPDQLGSYIKVSKPSVWMLLGIIAALIVAGAVWFFAGTIAEGPMGPAVMGESSGVVYVPLSGSSAVGPGQVVMVECDGAEVEGRVESVAQVPVALSVVEEACASANLAPFANDAWAVAVTVDADVREGVYDARIITSTHRPIRLLLGLD